LAVAKTWRYWTWGSGMGTAAKARWRGYPLFGSWSMGSFVHDAGQEKVTC